MHSLRVVHAAGSVTVAHCVATCCAGVGSWQPPTTYEAEPHRPSGSGLALEPYSHTHATAVGSSTGRAIQ